MAARVLLLLIGVVAVPWQHLKYIIRSIRKKNVREYTNAMSEYYYNKAYSLDQHGNASYYSLLNDVQVHPDGHRFGDPGETLSAVYGANYPNKLYPAGQWWAKTIDKVFARMGDDNHIEKAAEKIKNDK